MLSQSVGLRLSLMIRVGREVTFNLKVTPSIYKMLYFFAMLYY